MDIRGPVNTAPRESVREATLLYQEDHLEVPVFSWLSAWSGGHRAKSLARVAGPWPHLRKHSCPTDVDRAQHCPGHHSPRSDAEPDRLSTAGLCECGYCASKCPALWLHALVTQRSGMLPAARRSESVCAEHSFPRTSIREGAAEPGPTPRTHGSDTKTKLPECFWDGAHLSAGGNGESHEKPRQHSRTVLTRRHPVTLRARLDKGQPVTSGPPCRAQSSLTIRSRSLLLLGGKCSRHRTARNGGAGPGCHETPGSSFLFLSAPPHSFPSN